MDFVLTFWVIWNEFWDKVFAGLPQDLDLILRYIPKKCEDLIIGFVDRENNGNEDYLGDNREHYTADHHEKKISLIEICPTIVEVIEPVTLVDTSC
jgi:hypothetical protein